MSNLAANDQMLTVYFDGACPLCRREISFYRRRKGADAVEWQDVSGSDGAVHLPPGLSRKAALSRFHVRLADGELKDGAAAFAELWKALPQFRLAGMFVSTPPFRWIAEIAYRLFLPIRPHLQRRFLKQDRCEPCSKTDKENPS